MTMPDAQPQPLSRIRGLPTKPGPVYHVPADGQRGFLVRVGGLEWLALTLAAGALLSGCSRSSPANASQKNGRSAVAVPVVVAKAEARDVPLDLRNIGNVE